MNNNEMQSRIENEFQCQRCNECCRKPGYVYLKEGEAERIAEFLKMPLYDFTDEYCDVIDQRRLVLKKLPNEVCIFLTVHANLNGRDSFENKKSTHPPTDEKNKIGEGFGREGCCIHEVKPEQCRDFPYRWHTPASWEYCAGLRELSR